MVDLCKTPSDFAKLKRMREGDDPDVSKAAARYIEQNMEQPFTVISQDRDLFDGPATLGQSLELREDYYAFTYLY